MSADHAWRALDQVSALIRFADAKAVAALSVSSVLGGWDLTTFPPRHLLGGEMGRTLLVAGSLTALAVSASFALLAIRPQTRTAFGGSVIHFEEAARRFGSDPDRFARSCESLFAADNRVTDAICRQLGVNAILATRKFRNVNRAFTAFAFGLGFAAAATLASSLLIARAG